MKLISSLIASCLALTYAQDNSTVTPMSSTMDMSSTEDMESASTTMYTTQEIVYVSIPYVSADDPTNDLTVCEYSLMVSFDNLEAITITICGYTDEDEISYTNIKLDIPSDRWIIFGLKADGDVSNTDTFANYDGYNIQIPLENDYNEIEEAYYMADKEEIELPSTIEVISDTTSEGRRTLRLMRMETIMETAINDTGLADNRTASDIVDYYFDFSDISACEDEARISFTYGPKENARLSATKDKFIRDTYGNRKAMDVSYDQYGDENCDGNSDDAPPQLMNIFVAVIIGFIAMLF